MGVVGMRWNPSRYFVGGAVREGSRAADIDPTSIFSPGADDDDMLRLLLLKIVVGVLTMEVCFIE